MPSCMDTSWVQFHSRMIGGGKLESRADCFSTWSIGMGIYCGSDELPFLIVTGTKPALEESSKGLSHNTSWTMSGSLASTTSAIFPQSRSSPLLMPRFSRPGEVDCYSGKGCCVARCHGERILVARFLASGGNNLQSSTPTPITMRTA